MEEKIKLREYMAYGSTDFASNLMWATVSTYLMFFYTDVFGIAVASVGVLLLVVRIFDAFVDPGIGLIIDKTRSKFGKSRPYFLWMAVPFCVFTFLTFTTPELSTTGKLIYAYITYLILSIVFSAVNIPVTSILPRLTSDPNQRNVLTSFRMVGMFLATLFVSIATLPIVNALGGEITQQAQQKGFALTGLIYGLIGAALFIFAFFNLKEKVGVSAQKQSMVDSFKALKGNWPWLILLAICIISQVTLMMRTSSSLYFLKYNLGREDLFPYLGMILIVMLPVFVIIPRLAKRFGKRNLFIIGNIITIIGYILLYFFAETSIPMLLDIAPSTVNLFLITKIDLLYPAVFTKGYFIFNKVLHCLPHPFQFLRRPVSVAFDLSFIDLYHFEK